jgi:hypothetical protein
MGLFDGQGMGNAPETLGDMYRGVGRSIGTGMIDPYMEGKGFTSKENQILNVMKGVDLTSAKSVSDTFNRIMAIDPQAAAEFQKQVMPMLQSNQTAQAAAASRNDPGTFRKSLDTAALILGCDLDNDADCRKNAYELVKDYKRQDVWEGESTEALVDEMVLIQQSGAEAIPNMAKFTQLLDILPQIYTGWGAGIIQDVNRVGAMFGLPSATEAAGQAEIFAQGGISIALEYIKLTKGAISDREFETFLGMAPGLGRTQLGNRLMLDTAMQYARFNKNKAAEQTRWIAEQRAAGKAPLLEEWSAHLLEWASKPENIIKLPTDAQYKESQEAPSALEADEQQASTVDELTRKIEEISGMNN